MGKMWENRIGELLLFGEEAERAGCGKRVKEQILSDLLGFLIYVAGDRGRAERTAGLFLENGIPAGFHGPDKDFGERVPESLRVFVRADRLADDGPTGREDSAAGVLVETFRLAGEELLCSEPFLKEEDQRHAVGRMARYLALCRQALA